MAKITSGPGWSLSSDETPKPAKKENNSPQPKIYLEKRSGKYVTNISGLHTYGVDRLNQIAKELKTSCGAGGTVKDGIIEIQGDRVDVIKNWFSREKF